MNMTPPKVFRLWCFLMLVSTFCVEAGFIGNIFQKLMNGLYGDINTVAYPIDSAVLTTATRDCEIVKRWFRIAYEQYDTKDEPDLNNLDIYFKSKGRQKSYKINEAAKKIANNPDFNPSYKVVIYAHGFLDSPNGFSATTISNALLAKGGYNVIALDGSSLIRFCYLRSTTYVRFLGQKLGEVIVALTKEGVRPGDITIVGHSLGAHIGSFAAKKFNNLTSKVVGRLTGLDPAGPCFENLMEDLKLKKTDAKFVDVIHSNAGVFGTNECLGQVDYFPNGGFKQPDCLLQTCSHFRAWAFYASSVINPDLFPAVKCKSWDHFKRDECDKSDISYMGFGSTPKSFGNYYLITDGASPYGLGKKGLKYTGGNGLLSKLDYYVNDVDED